MLNLSHMGIDAMALDGTRHVFSLPFMWLSFEILQEDTI